MSFSFRAPGIALLVLAAAAAFCSTDYKAYSKRLEAATSTAEKVRILRELESEVTERSPVLDYVREATANDTPDSSAVKTAEQMVAIRASLVSKSVPTSDVKKSAASITSSALYRDTGQKKASNWIDRAIDRLRFRERGVPRDLATPDAESVSYAVDLLVVLVWAALALGVGALLFVAFQRFSWRRSLKRKAMALLEDDEPIRSADEWLLQADELAAKGDHRGAVRCLYLACLLRLDENGVARFERSQTNWEHLARIHSSPALPEGLDFREPTGAFDRIWYGSDVKGQSDVDLFRGFYIRLMSYFGGAR